VLGDRISRQATEQAIAVLSKATKRPIGLLITVGEVRAIAEKCRLIDKATAQAAGIKLL